ncbi:hypothetical protein EC846_3106 [Acinetobacter sp. BIGb0102]|uniref:hypothetical protein n=1 Tax=Acinetobacter sp. BIGb0102 TaxID=2485131 RepID=UPI000F4F557D|nr:hypothetical protein [Acinetobacter sp. BIGb0102]RPE28217.1 hypothetical protein EC846_3106 [Acinetobacter sp. BIGb0102]
MNSNPEKFLNLNELIEAHLDPLKMTADLHQQILQSFLLICQEKNLVDNSAGETFYPIPYQEITECIYALDFEFSNELNSVIEGLIEPLKKLLKIDGLSLEQIKLDENKKAIHQLNAYKRFVSHIQLAVCQRNFIAKQTVDVILQLNELKHDNKKLTKQVSESLRTISTLDTQIRMLTSDLDHAKELLNDSRDIIVNSVTEAKAANLEASSAKITVEEIEGRLVNVQDETRRALEAAQKAQKDAEDSKTQFVTILGIFASIIVALFGGISLVKAATELLSDEKNISLFVFVISILLLSFLLLIMLLTSWILALNTKNYRSYNLFKVGLIVSLVSVISIISLMITIQ